MKNKTIFTYLAVYSILNSIGILIASHFWWTDGLNLSFLKEETVALLFSAGMLWIGIIYFTIFLIRKFIVKITLQNFIGPIDLVSNEYYKNEIGEKSAIRFRQSMILSFPIFIVTVVLFIISMNAWKSFQLKNFGKSERVTIKEIKKDIKELPYVYFEYNNKKSSTLIRNYKNLKIGDTIDIQYSIRNPKIIKWE